MYRWMDGGYIDGWMDLDFKKEEWIYRWLDKDIYIDR